MDNTLALLYRGVSKTKDNELNGKLLPKGNKPEVVARYDGKINYDGKFVYGESEDNGVRAHHIESGLYDGCFISATKNEEVAVKFATSTYSELGWVYVLNARLFEEHGVKSREFNDPLHPDHEEVTLRAHDYGAIPEEVIVEKYEVDRDGRRIT